MRALVVSLVCVGALAVSVVRAASPPLQSSTDLAAIGLYRFADGTYAALVKPTEGGAGIRVIDYSTGALRQLSQESSNTFVAGPGVAVPRPVSMRIRLLTGARGAVVGLRLDGRPARRVPLVARNVVFHDHDVLLGCRLLLPSGRGPFPAVEIVPGSPATLRDGYDLWAMFFASQGYAVLSCDKRGVGQSTGTYVHDATLVNLHNLAADTIAGVTWLRHQPEIERSRIGLTGGSQAGWVMVMAAAESGRVRFLAIQSGPAMSVGRQLAYAGRTKQGALEPPPTEAEIQARLANVPESGYDPKPDIASLKIPVLWQLGSVDKRMYTPETVADLAAINASGTHDFTVKVYPGGAHSLRLTANGLISEEKRSPGFVPGLFNDLAAWLAAHVRAR